MNKIPNRIGIIMDRLQHLLAAGGLLIAMGLLLQSCGDNELCCAPPDGEAFSHTEAPGASAEAFLRADTYTSLNVEIDYMPGHEPSARGLDSLKAFLQQRLNKTTVTLRTPSEIPSGGEPEYSADEIRALENEYRNNFTAAGSSALEAYFIVVDGAYQAQANVLGIAYFNTSMAFFGPTMDEVSGGVTQPPAYKIQGTVFRHEFGHTMGLVGNGTPVQSSHKTNGSAHCTTDGCLMEPEVETSDFFANLFDGDIPALRQFCTNDLQANGGK